MRCTSVCAISVCLGLLATASTGRAQPPAPKGDYVVADPNLVEMAAPAAAAGKASNIIFLNGCFDGGCTITPGFESSIDNSSSIIKETATIPPFAGGAAAWDAIVECMRGTYAPFDVVITDEDPGKKPHFEAIVAGRPQDAGFHTGIGGVAPFSCGVINNAITYTFADVYNGNVAQICWTISQESAHAFGLDHEFLCKDPMTYLTSCGLDKIFQDNDSRCGEYSPRDCLCGTQTQNSFQRIKAQFGPSVPTPPDVTILEPVEGQEVSPGFEIRADADDDVAVSRAELWINGHKVASDAEPPWIFEAPQDVGQGRLIVEVRAVDNFDAVGTDSIHVVLGDPCFGAADCAGDETCVDGRCVPGPGTPGGLGEICSANGDCASELCADDGEGERYCVERCRLGQHGCPPGYGCRDSGDYGVCWPGYDDSSGCGCGAGGDSAPLLSLLFVAGLWLLLGRRRRSAAN